MQGHGICHKSMFIPPKIDEVTLKILQEAFMVKLKHIRKQKLDKATVVRLLKRVCKQVIDDYTPHIETIKKKNILEKIEDDLNEGMQGL